MIKSHVPGFPRIGKNRELKKLTESYWKGEIGEDALERGALEIKKANWRIQAESGLNWVTVNDFSFYDPILDFACALGVIPKRFGEGGEGALNRMFRMARGKAPKGGEVQACEMTKWFDTNYHYIVPEFETAKIAEPNIEGLLADVKSASEFGPVKCVLPGPITFLWLGKEKEGLKNRLELLPRLSLVYSKIFSELKRAGVDLVQMDEPALVFDLPSNWVEGFYDFLQSLETCGLKTMLASYFGQPIIDRKKLFDSPFDIFHFDFTRADEDWEALADSVPSNKSLSMGIVDGRNIWKTDLNRLLAKLKPIADKMGERLLVSASCSLLHVPIDLESETKLDAEIKNWLSFAVQKLEEIDCLKSFLNGDGKKYPLALESNRRAFVGRGSSSKIHSPEVQKAVENLSEKDLRRKSDFAERKKIQNKETPLPLFPTTTIGSFPQTPEIRKSRRAFKNGKLSAEEYRERMRNEILEAVRVQEEIGLDVLVHGEPERNDMVEYFGERLEGFAFSENGWVQSYGMRCVKPPILFGDVRRPEPMTVEWSSHAQSLTDKPMKGMLTGPVTILQWSFVRDDLPRSETCKQIALAIRREVADLEQAGIRMIQVDEPALREGLPLARKDWDEYLKWAGDCFKLATSGAGDATQIHTHMCYCEFNDIMPSIGALDADVISIEASRSQMELLDSFKDFSYPNDIGPGVYDIHSPRVPSEEEMLGLLRKALRCVPADRLWANPDCGLKTRGWSETKASLTHMVNAAKALRRNPQTSSQIPK